MIIKSDPDIIKDYLSDASNLEGMCKSVYIPENLNEIIEIVKECNNKNIKLTISGNRTGLTGGAVPFEGILLSLEKFKNLEDFDKEEMTVWVEPSVSLREIQTFAESQNLLYPPDATERDSSIGGNVGTNASGARTFKYGPTRNYIEALQIVLPDGELLNLERGQVFESADCLSFTVDDKNYKLNISDIYIPETSKQASGFFIKKGMDLIDLFIGSEGLLGIITKIKLKFTPKPENLLSAIVFFNSEADAIDFIEEARHKSCISMNESISDFEARALEFFDYHSLKLIEKSQKGIPSEAKSSVWIEQELNEKNEEFLFETWIELIEKFNGDLENSWIANDISDIEKFKQFRHALPVQVNELMAGRGFLKVGTDTSVPDDRFKEYFEFCKNEIIKNNIEFVSYGHAGNSHLHVNMLPKTKEEFNKAKEIYAILCAKAVEMKGTISAEHGIGKIKRSYFSKMYSRKDQLVMAEIKKTLDTHMILNYGNLFSEEIYKELN